MDLIIQHTRTSSATHLIGSHSNILDLRDPEMGTGHSELVYLRD